MRQRFIVTTAMLVLVASLPARQSRGQQPQKTPAVKTAAPAPAKAHSIEIYRIDLEPTGTTLTLSKPMLEGDFYTFISLPEKTPTRIRKSAVKKITPLTSDLNKETAYQIELLPSGSVLARERPQLKTGAYVFHTYKTGTLMSVKKADVKQVTLLQGLPAFKAKQEEMGAKLLVGNLSMEGGSVRVIPDPGAHTAPPAGDASAPSNWNYDGVPGATDAYAPSNAVVAHPGDVPKAPEPPPPPPPR